MSEHTCQFCGAQSTALESYFQWKVCNGCAAKLHAPQSARTTSNSTKRTRCCFCGGLHERHQLHKFTGTKPRDYIGRELYGRLICDRCHQFLAAACIGCGAITLARYDASSDGLEYWCAQCHQAHEVGRRLGENEYDRSMHAHRLAEYAGERLEWPCSSEKLKRVWRSAARRTHPDTGGSSETFRAAKESYDALMEVVR